MVPGKILFNLIIGADKREKRVFGLPRCLGPMGPNRLWSFSFGHRQCDQGPSRIIQPFPDIVRGPNNRSRSA